MQTLRKLFGFSLPLLAVVALGGCDAKPPAAGESASKDTTAAAALPADLFLAAEPADAVGVRAAKAQAKAGQELTVRGRIGGRKDPFVQGSAMFLLVDRALPTCQEKHGNGCPTPWDYCCEPREDVLASTATVQVNDKDGRPLRLDLNGEHGLVPGAEVVVAATVASVDQDGTLILTARGFYIVQ
ncbi:MAG: hypothetical protein PVJ57_02575 [Phycisphaerae bacterium]|jgi:hypothetical protein